MTGELVLAIDQGTTNTKALAVDGAGRIVAQAARPMAVNYPRPGWAEQSADEIWAAVETVIGEIAGRVGAAAIGAVGISNQRESVVVWDAASGRPLAPAIIWQCRRTADRCAAIRAAGHESLIAARTGLPVDPLFPAAKIAWILDEVPGARARAERGELRAGTVDAWLLAKLTRGEVFATDHSNASRTQLFDTARLIWDETLAEIFRVPLTILPSVRSSDAHFGDVAGGTTALLPGTPIRAAIGDSHAALYGHGVRGPGTVKATYGTGSSLMTLTHARITSGHGLSGTIAWSRNDGVVYALEGNISVSGQAAAFMAELLGLSDAAALGELASTVADTNGVSFVPALVGLGAPHWRDDARGLVAGLSLGTKRAHLARAALEAIAFQVADVFFAMELDLGTRLKDLSVDGGASRNDLLMQFQADILGRDVIRGGTADLSALGAAHLTGMIAPPEAAAARFVPAMPRSRAEPALQAWHKAVARTLD